MGLRKKRAPAKNYVVIEKEDPTPSNGHGKQQDTDSEMIGALMKLKDSGALTQLDDTATQQDQEQTKFTILKDLSNPDPDKIKMHTELDKDEILIMNRLQMVVLLIPKIFGETDSNKKSIAILQEHMREHRLNKMALNRKRELDLVYAVHGADNSVPVTQNAIGKILGLKK